jgi:NTP pyrophosphatase (non-canonical NTP hydrolase)
MSSAGSNTTSLTDDNIKLPQLKELIKRFCEDREWDQFHGAKDLAIGIITESSELLELFRFKSQSEIDQIFLEPAKRESLTDEIGDIFYFLLRFSQKYKVDLTESLIDKMKKNSQRYPVSKSRGSNKKYNEL